MDEMKPPWDQGIPTHLVPALKALREAFEEGNWKVGQLTEVLCFACIHGTEVDRFPEYLLPLNQLKAMVGPAATQRFNSYLKSKHLSSVLKGFLDLYLDGIGSETVRIFRHLAEIAKANDVELGVPHLRWAALQMERMIEDQVRVFESWIRNVCDKQVFDFTREVPDDELIFWRSWQAPRFLVMKPAGPQTYEEERTWERQDPDTSLRWLRHFSKGYVILLKAKLSDAVNAELVSAAKQPSAPRTPTSIPQPAPVRPAAEKPATVNQRREKQKRNTEKRHAAWAKQYRALVTSRPGMSDVWYSRKIAEMPVGGAASPETIRKNMK